MQLDDNFLKETGFDHLEGEERQYFLQYVMLTLQERVGERLTEGLSDEQLDEIEHKYVVKDGDNQETATQKQHDMQTWLETNNSNYKQIIAEEFEKVKAQLKANPTGDLSD
jgi:hypothetical protein